MKQEAYDVWRHWEHLLRFLFYVYVVGQTLVSRIEESNWFQQRFLFSIPSKSFFFFCFVYLSHYRTPIFSPVLWYHSSYYFLFFCYPSLFLNHVYHLIALQQPVFCSIRDGYIMFKHIINVILSWACSFDIMFPSISSPISVLLFYLCYSTSSSISVPLLQYAHKLFIRKRY